MRYSYGSSRQRRCPSREKLRPARAYPSSFTTGRNSESPTNSPHPTEILSPVWQQRATRSGGGLLKGGRPGASRGTPATTVVTMRFLVQVNHLHRAACFCSREHFLLVLSCPHGFLNTWRVVLCSYLCSFCANIHVVRLLLLLSGDVEVIPGPESNDSPPAIISLAQAFSNMEVAYTAILAALKAIPAAQDNLEKINNRLSSRIDALQKNDGANYSYVEGCFLLQDLPQQTNLGNHATHGDMR